MKRLEVQASPRVSVSFGIAPSEAGETCRCTRSEELKRARPWRILEGPDPGASRFLFKRGSRLATGGPSIARFWIHYPRCRFRKAPPRSFPSFRVRTGTPPRRARCKWARGPVVLVVVVVPPPSPRSPSNPVPCYPPHFWCEGCSLSFFFPRKLRKLQPTARQSQLLWGFPRRPLRCLFRKPRAAARSPMAGLRPFAESRD